MKDREGGEKGNWGKETLLVSKKRGLGYTENGRLNEKEGGVAKLSATVLDITLLNICQLLHTNFR